MTIKKGLDLLKDPTLKEQYPVFEELPIGKFAARLDVNSCHYADARLLQTAG